MPPTIDGSSETAAGWPGRALGTQHQIKPYFHETEIVMTEYSGTSTKKGRGQAQRSLALIKAMYEIAAATQPITGRGIGYKLFTQKLIPSMSRKSMRVVYRLLKEAREEGTIAWAWVVDETRSAERVATWADPEAYSRTVANSYRRDFWNLQPIRVEIWSEKGTVRGVLQPVLSEYQVTFRALHVFNSATQVWDISQDDDGRDLIALYVGDYDPSGMCCRGGLAEAPGRIRRRSCGGAADRTDARTASRPSVLSGVRKEEGHAL
jgi:hypothetical protein